MLVQLVVRLIVLVVLEILKSTLPDTTKSSSRVSSDRRPSGLSTEELHALGLSRERVVENTCCASNAAELLDVVESAAAEDILRDERAAVKDHDGLRLEGAAVGYNSALSEDVLLELVATSIIHSNLDLLHNKHNGANILELVLEVALAEKVVQVIVEPVVDLVDNEDLVDLLHDLLLEAVVDDLQVLLLDLNDLLLLIEVVEAVRKVEAIAAETVQDSTVEIIAAEDVAALGYRGRDGLSSCEKV